VLANEDSFPEIESRERERESFHVIPTKKSIGDPSEEIKQICYQDIKNNLYITCQILTFIMH